MLWYYFHWRFHMVSISLVVLQALIHTDVIKPTGKELSIAMSSFSKYSTLFKCFDLIRMFFFFLCFQGFVEIGILKKDLNLKKKPCISLFNNLFPFDDLLVCSCHLLSRKKKSLALWVYCFMHLNVSIIKNTK